MPFVTGLLQRNEPSGPLGNLPVLNEADQCSNEVAAIMGKIFEETIGNPNGAGSGRPRLKILLADDNPALLLELQRALHKEFEVVNTVADGRALLEQYDRLHPDVIVTDISMPVMDGFEAVAKLRCRVTAKVVFLTVHEEHAFVEEAKALGAMGYVLKRCRPSVLSAAIRSANDGRFFLCPELCMMETRQHQTAGGSAEEVSGK
jgi:DNA-binding NarL/FixJ family response regulator